MNKANLKATYDRIADEYARRIYGELDHKPFDREMLQDFAEKVRGGGLVCDLGCGPGHVARYLRDLEIDVVGIDLSEKMIEQARKLNPDIEFLQGDMTRLKQQDASLAGIVAAYSIIHLTPSEIPVAFQEMHRVLRSDGWLLLSFHIGSQTLRMNEWWGQKVDIDFHFLDPAVITRELESAGFEINRALERDPYPDVEYKSCRCYILAKS